MKIFMSFPALFSILVRFDICLMIGWAVTFTLIRLGSFIRTVRVVMI